MPSGIYHHKPHQGFQKGKLNPNWGDGRTKKDGYIAILKPNHPYCENRGYVREHRLVMEEYLGRNLEPNEVVHHENGIRNDNRIENLILFVNKGEHIKYHLTGQTSELQM